MNALQLYLHKLDQLDKAASSYIHQMKLPPIVQYYVNFWAWIFNREMTIILIFIVAAIFPPLITQVTQFYGLYYGLIHFGLGVMGFAAVIVLKKTFRRSRPVVEIEEYRIKDIRSKELDTSFPSGDMTQATCFVWYFAFAYRELLDNSRWGWVSLALILINVAFARVFFRCHYIGDTLGGFVLGSICGHININLIKYFVYD